MSKQSKNITSLDFDIFKTTSTTYYPDGAITPLDMKENKYYQQAINVYKYNDTQPFNYFNNFLSPLSPLSNILI